MAGLEEDVGLDISSALASVDELASTAQDTLTAALVGAAEAFSTAIADAAQSVSGEGGAGFTVLGESATSAATDVGVLGQASADAADGVGQLSDAADNAAGGVQKLGDSASSAGDSAEGGGHKFDVFGGAALGVSSAMQLAKGNVSGVTEGLNSLPAGLGAAAGGFAAVGVAAGAFFDAGLKAQTVQDRLNLVFGTFKDTVENIDVGGLTGSLDSLSVKAGSTGVGLGLTASSLGQFVEAGGQSKESAANLAQSFEALDLKAAALNPSLGGADAASQRLFTALLSGRDKALAPFALGIDAASIKTEAYSLGLEKVGVALTPLDKLTAGVTLATQKAGDTLGTSFAAGADLAGTKARALRAELEQTVEKLGQPFVSPFLQLGTELEPIAVELGKVAASVVTAFLPAISGIGSALGAAAPALAAVGDALQAIAPLLGPAAEGFVAFKVATIAGDAVKGFAVSLGLIPGVTVPVTAAMGLADEAVVTFTESVVANVAVVETSSGLLVPASAGFLAVGTAAETAAAEIDVATTAMDVNPVFLAATALAGLAVAFGLAGSGANSATDQLKGFAKAQEDVGNASLVANFEKQTHAFDEFGGASKRTEIGLVSFKAVADDNVGTAQRLLKALSDAGDVTTGYQEILDKAVGKQKEATAAKQSDSQSTKDLTATQVDQNISTQNATQALSDYASGTSTAADTVKALDQASSDLKDTLDLLFGRFLSGEEAEGAFEQGIAKLNFDIATGKQPLDAFTTNTTAGGQSLLHLGDNAETAAEAILKQTNNVGLAIVPLQQYRGEVQQVRDKLAASGLDTTFLDSILGSVDQAIAGVQAKNPEAAAAATALSAAGSGALNLHSLDWTKAGEDSGGKYATGVQSPGTVFQAAAAGADLSKKGSDAAQNTGPQWQDAGARAAGELPAGVRAQGSNAFDAGGEIGATAIKGVAGTGYGFFLAGAAAGDAFGTGIRAAALGVISAAEEVAGAAVAAIKAKLQIRSPSQVVHDEVGVPFAQGFASGIDAGAPFAVASSSALGLAALGATKPGGTVGALTARQIGVPTDGPGSFGHQDDHSITNHIDARGIASPVQVARKVTQRQVALQYMIGT